jgi:hypothetical protein
MKKKKHIPSWKVFFTGLFAIVIFFGVSSFFDIMVGDGEPVRYSFFILMIIALLAASLQTGAHWVLVQLKKAFGM